MVDDSGIGPASVPSEAEAGRASAIILAGLFGGSVVVADRYELGSEIGRGGLGVVHRARDLRLDRDVALKFPTGASTNPDIVADLEREAKVLARLKHPNIVAVYDVGHSDRGVYLAMELVEGQPMSAWLRESKRDWRAIVALMREAGAGLAAAHEAGVVHRDFKPANVMIDEQGAVRVVDFGLARDVSVTAADPSTDPSVSDHRTRAAGTPPYMAPEQFDGHVSAASDQFAFCTALYEGICGRRPWPGRERGVELGGPSASVIDRELHRGGMPKRLRKVVLRGLAEAPEQRFDSMASLVDAISPRPGRGWRGWALAGVAAAGAAGTWAANTGDPCAGRGMAATAVAQAAAALGESSDAELEEGIDAAAEAWNVLDRQTCRAHAEEKLSSTLYELRSRCLERAIVASEITLETIAGGDYSTATAQRAVLEALDPTRCEDDEGLLLGAPEPGYDVDAGERIQRAIDRAHVSHVLGDDSEWLSSLERVHDGVDDRVEVLPDALWLSVQLGEALVRADRLDEAEDVLMGALTEAKQHPKWGRTVAMLQVQLAKLALRRRNFDQAKLWISLAEPTLESLPQQQHAYAAAVFHASLANNMERPQEALAQADRAGAIAGRAGPASRAWAGSGSLSAELAAIRCGAHSQLGQHTESRKACERALAIFDQLGVEGGRTLAALLHTYGLALKRAGDLEASIPLYERSAALKEEAGLLEGAAETWVNVANVFEALHRHEEGMAAYARAEAALRGRRGGPWVSVHFNRSIAHAAAENWEAAAVDAREALETQRELGTSDPSELYDFEVALGTAEAKCGRRDVAIESLERALRHERTEHDPYSKAELRLALARLSSGSRAEALRDEAVAFAKQSGDEALLNAARSDLQR